MPSVMIASIGLLESTAGRPLGLGRRQTPPLLEPLFVRPELRLGRLLVAAHAADGQRREDGALEELAAGRLAFDGVLEPCAGQLAISCKLV